MSDDGYYDVATQESRKTLDSAINKRWARPVGSQLDKIEQDVKAALEGQARLNALVDGLRVTLSGVDTVQDAIRFEAERDRKLVNDRLEALEKHFTSGPSWTQGFTTAAKQYNEELSGHLQAIEAKLEKYAPLSAPGEYSCASCGMFMVKPCKHWRKQRSASKKPSHKARR